MDWEIEATISHSITRLLDYSITTIVLSRHPVSRDKHVADLFRVVDIRERIGIECDEGFACVLGVCTSCECSACTDGTVCAANSETAGAKICVDTGCEGKTCGANTHCVAGECQDNCTDVTCPTGQLCQAGECVADPNGNPAGGGMDGLGGSLPIDPGIDPIGGTGSSSGGSSACGAGY